MIRFWILIVLILLTGCKVNDIQETDPLLSTDEIDVSFVPSEHGLYSLVIFNRTDKELWIDVDKSNFHLYLDLKDQTNLQLFPEEMEGATDGFYIKVKPWQNVKSADFITFKLYCNQVIDFSHSYKIRWKLILYNGRSLHGEFLTHLPSKK